MSLKNKSILITRNQEQAGELAELLKNYGAKPILFPTIEIIPSDSFDKLDSLLNSSDDFDGILFTSRNAVKFFFERFNYLNFSTSVLKNKLIFAVGEKTKSEIEKNNQKCTAFPEFYTSESLADIIKKYNIKGKKFIFPRSNISREEIVHMLSSYGAEIISVVVYQTICASPKNVDEIRKRLIEKCIDVITFTSPSTAINFFKIISDNYIKNSISELTKIAVIGKTTAITLEKIGIKPDILAEPSTIDGLIKNIKIFFEQN